MRSVLLCLLQIFTLVDSGGAYFSEKLFSINGFEFAGAQNAIFRPRPLTVNNLFLRSSTKPRDNLHGQCAVARISSMPNECDLCQRIFQSARGLNKHLHHCRRTVANGVAQQQPQAALPEILVENNNVSEINLPKHNEINIEPKYQWNGIEGHDFAAQISDLYEECVKWRKNLFKLPTGAAAKDFIKELAFWIEQFNRSTDFQGIALKVYMVLPSLLLQKPDAKSKSALHLARLKERLELWKSGQLNTLLRECRRIQSKLASSKRRAPEDTARIFSKLVFEGKINAALKLLSNDSNGVLELTEQTMNELYEKHPEPSPIEEHSLLFGPIEQVLPCVFDPIDEQSILKAAQSTKGACGPSALDADQYRHLLVSRKYKQEGKELREQLALLAKKLATTVVDPKTLEAYTACRLVPLDKAPGVRPIGVGEVLRRIIGKVIGSTLKDDIQEAAGPLQVATGLKGGAEAAIHAMRDIFEQDACNGVILVDASNAFNRLNRRVALHNIQITCPEFATVLINTYRQPARLFVTGGKEIASREGTTQGDNLAMAFYGLSTVPLLQALREAVAEIKQVWLADDATGAGKLAALRRWWTVVIEVGKKFGYYVNESKSWLILKDDDLLDEAMRLFDGTGIKITTAGKRHLGAAIGSMDFRKQYVGEKLDEWRKEVNKLTEYVNSQPHKVYAAFVHGEQLRLNR